MPAPPDMGVERMERPAEATEPADARRTGEIVVAYDGSEAAEWAIGESARLLAERRALVLVVWKAGLAFALIDLAAVPGLPPAPLDVRTALEIDESMYERARQLAARGAGIAREAGFQAQALVVAEDPEVPIAETIVNVARERGSPVIVIGERARGRLGEVFLGSTSRDVIRYAPCPVVVTRHGGSRER